jgi:hypothetical protein
MKNPDQPLYDDDWEADWEGHRRWQLTAGLAATPAQRLAWLEEMIELAHQHIVLLDAKIDDNH